MNHIFSMIVAVAGIAFLFIFSSSMSSLSHKHGKGQLVWADEFKGTGLPDSTKWGYEKGDGCPGNCGWGNNELQYYTVGRLENARAENGNLVIEAHREKMKTREYSSSRMMSKHKGDWTYGRIEVRAKLPKGIGVWPAIWMLPTDWAYGDWPASGEIDIMEHVGYIPDSVFGTVHTKRYNGLLGTQKSKGIASKTVNTNFHTYGMEWNKDKIDFLFDDKVYHSFPNRHEGPDAWPFDLDFHLVLNMAVGGNWGGKMGVDTTIWPQQMLVDYVRVYQ